ncbi:TetR family transcriptional regulator [Acetobacterium paludosum]|uniref:TetR family transcriptional regulator n=1 Tax=Acetobacterium paludosum TaxID=52693 RepID=A0A923HUP1_9FIRM|nr:TetR/AcrR family transcriptional regulator [Acetobacterium paludosum]MBC3887502.1 TetR family transcriptional regulator [Acetobacterium paludosum]
MNTTLTMKDIKHQAILNSATELLALKPTATLQAIADYSKIGIATLHRHFVSREALLDELALNAIHLVEETFASLIIDPDDMKASLKRLFDALIPLGNKIYFLGTAASIDENPTIIAGETHLKRPILDAIETWQHNGCLKKDYPSRWILNVIYSLLFMTWQDIQAGNLAKNDATDLLLNTVLSGFSEIK